MPKPARYESDATATPTPPAPLLPRRSTIKSGWSRFSLFGAKSRTSRFDTASIVSHEAHAFAPCKLCHTDLKKGAKIFAIVHVICCVIVLIVHFLELLAALKVIDIYFEYMNPNKKLDETLLSMQTMNSEDFEKAWAPSLLCCITDSLQLMVGCLLIPATFKAIEKYCAIWLVATYLLYFPHMFYFGFAIAIGTSWASLILQLIDSLLYTPYAIWLVRCYMETLEIEKELAAAAPPPPPPLPEPSSITSPSSPHHHLDVIMEHKKGAHLEESSSQHSHSVISIDSHHHNHHHQPEHEHKTPRKSVLKKPGSHPLHPHHPPDLNNKKPARQKVDTVEEIGKRLW